MNAPISRVLPTPVAKAKHKDGKSRSKSVKVGNSAFSAASMADEAAKEKLRQEALKQVQDVLTQEEGKPIVEDLLFNNLIIQ